MMRVLLLCDRPPHPHAATTGDQLAYNRLRLLADAYDVTCAYLNWENEPAAPDGSPLHPYRLIALPVPPKSIKPQVYHRTRRASLFHAWRHTLLDANPYFIYNRRQPELLRALADLIQALQPHVIHVGSMTMLYGVPRVSQPLVAELVDLWSRSHWRRSDQFSKPTHRFQHWMEGKKVERVERRELQRAQAIVVSSDLEAQAAKRLGASVPTFVIPPSVDLSYFCPQPLCEEPAAVLFTGSLDYPPNIEAVELFARDIFPRIKQAIPAVRWYIVGRYAPPHIQALASTEIVVTGAVPDVRPFYARATVCVVPILHGGGIRTKILEAWAMERAVVSTTLGAESSGAIDGENILIRDTPEAFAAAVIELLQQPHVRARLGANGRRVVVERFSL